ncbi:hypothetical protein C8D87_106542 [Lentzea atacamensis]|uniref:Uncharacterized protein n=1 Tax=Lentzea atacamensis TaxID=531938 RepID=A0ABX9E6N4_9PSEU|nr:hypothetical protein [Lentzea atacamensis]RAS64136.1 hypothetical protein C8D87_106542 [Lentzea atacamensis]
MVLRTAVGAAVGTVAGAGFLQTLKLFTRYCDSGPVVAGCGAAFPLAFGLNFSIWMVVAAALICTGFRALRTERGWWAAGIGSGLWFVLFLAVIHVRVFHLGDLYQEDVHRFLEIAYVLVACVGYAVAALCVGQRRTA